MASSARADVKSLLAHIAGLHSRTKHALAARLPPTGWALDEVLTYEGEFAELREQLRAADPKSFGSLSAERYGASILSRHDLLRQLVLETHGILVTASHLDLCSAPADLHLSQPHPLNNPGAFVRDHAVQIAVAVIAGGIVYYFGWTK